MAIKIIGASEPPIDPFDEYWDNYENREVEAKEPEPKRYDWNPSWDHGMDFPDYRDREFNEDYNRRNGRY